MSNRRYDTNFTDVTFLCEGKKFIKAHKIILAAASPTFYELLKENSDEHTTIIMTETNKVLVNIW